MPSACVTATAAVIGRKKRKAIPATSGTASWSAEERIPERTATPERYQSQAGFCRKEGIRRSKVSADKIQAARFNFEKLRPQIRASITHITIKKIQEAIIIVFLMGSELFFIC